MKAKVVRILLVVSFVLLARGQSLFAQGPASILLMASTNTTLLQQGGEWVPIGEEPTFPGGVKVFTNATFQINDGKIRTLREGQMLRGDGYLINPDGSTMPVFDHIAMKGGLVVVKDGEEQRPQSTLTLPDGSAIEPNGFYTRHGRSSRLRDGQYLTLDGSGQLQGLDTITLKNGRVVVSKSGALIPLESALVIMGMFDGTRINGQGVMMALDGSSRQLAEGETVYVPGVRADW